MRTSDLRLVVTNHARCTMESKGFDPAKVTETFRNPDYMTSVSKYPDQVRLIGNGLALVGKVNEAERVFVLITLYQDGVLTPPRPDQLTTPEGQRYAARYAQGLGRG